MNPSVVVLVSLFFALVSAHAQLADKALAGTYAPAFDEPLPYSSSLSEEDESAAASVAADPASSSGSKHHSLTIPFSAFGIGVDVGTEGPGVQVATPLLPRMNLRANGSLFSYSHTFPVQGASALGRLRFQNAAAMLDVFPFGGHFRISGGVAIYNSTTFNASVPPSPEQSFHLDGVHYTSDPSDPIHGDIDFNFASRHMAPRLTIGWGNMVPSKGHLVFSSEFGVQAINTPTVELSVLGSGCTGPNSTNCAPIDQNDVADEQQELRNDVSSIRFYPIVAFSVSYKIGRSRHNDK